MEINQEGLNLIKHFEGLYLKAYYCPANVLTIGYGTTGSRVKPGMVINESTAAQWLLEEVKEKEAGVSRLTSHLLNQEHHSNEFSTLVSFAYNCGVNALANSTLLKKLNSGDTAGAADELLRWNKGGGRVLAGLVRRRKAERELFLKPEGLTPVEQKNNIKPFKSNRFVITDNTIIKVKPVAHKSLDGNSKLDLPKGTELPILAWKKESKHYKISLGYKVGSEIRDLKLAGRNTWYFWPEHIQLLPPVEPEVKKPETLADKFAFACKERGYPLSKDKWNLIGISGLYPKSRDDSYGRGNTPDYFNDSLGFIAWDSHDNNWDFVGLYKSTTEPSVKYTKNPWTDRGCAVLQFGLHEGIWAFGQHKGYEAFQQVGPAVLVRDRNRNFKRDDKVTIERNRGVNLHSTRRDYTPKKVDVWSMGCAVVQSWSDFEKLKADGKRSPQYKINSRCRFDFRLLPIEWLD